MKPFLCSALLASILALGACGSDDDGPVAGGAAGDGIESDGGADASRFTPTLRPVDCAELASEAIVEVGVFGPENDRAECALVSVPADWSTPDGDTIELALYRVPSTAETPAADPVIYLEGGPGGAGVSTLPEFLDGGAGGAAYLRERSDVYVLDQRGTGYSRPALYCPELAAAERGESDLTVAWNACRDRFVADGVDFADYTSANNARDVEAVREALGIERWNLYGLSYGTRLALTAMRDVPGNLRSVVLDSVFPPQINGIAESAYPIYWAIEQIAINCAADDDCAENVGDIRAKIEQGVARLDANPLTIDGETFAAGDYLQLIAARIAEPELPSIVLAVADADDATLAASLAEAGGDEGDGEDELPPLDQVDPAVYPFVADTAEGMYAAVVCAEEVPFPADVASPDIAGGFSETLQRVVTEGTRDENIEIACAVLGVPAADPIEVAAVESAIPTLVLAGTADIQTPPTWSLLAAETLPNAQYAEFAGLGHGLLGDNACLNAITSDFLAAPEEAASQACIVDLPGVDYVTE